MKSKKLLSFALVLILCLSFTPFSALAATTYEEILAHNASIFNAAATGDNARRYYLPPTEKIESDAEAIVALATEVTKGYSDDLEKTRAVHDWVSGNIWYDMDRPSVPMYASEQTALLTLENGYAVCEGYAYLTVALLRAAGIPAKTVLGYGAEDGDIKASEVRAIKNHAWAEALVDGRWVIIDATWDTGNIRQNGHKAASPGMIDRMYFDISLNAFSRDHRIDEYRPYMGAVVSGNGTLTKYGGPGDDLPEGITAIGASAFLSCEALTQIVVPDGVVTLETGTLNFQKELMEVTLPASLRTIKNTALYGCVALERLHIPNGVTTIGSSAVSACTSLSDVFIPPTVTEIGKFAFKFNDSLLRVIIPPSVVSIGQEAFGYVFINGKTTLIEGFVIYGAKGSEAETYAGKNGIKFVQLSATPTSSGVLIDGEPIAFDAYNIAGNNFFKLRDLAYVLSGSDKEFAVGWDAQNNAISITTGARYTPNGSEMVAKGTGDKKIPVPTSSQIYLDGREISLTAYNIDGYNYFKLRDIGETFGFRVEWDSANNTIIVDTVTDAA